MEVIDRSEERMTLYRNDGSSVALTCENGWVKVSDSRKKGTTLVLKVDDFLASVMKSL